MEKKIPKFLIEADLRFSKELESQIKKIELQLEIKKRSIKWIIDSKIRNKEFIEQILYFLLESLSFGIGNEEFHELNDFYLTVNLREARVWKDYYVKISGKEY